jgi:two-component system OmpR family sensor kinase
VGRLFWKFFAFIWLAQLAGIVAIGSAFWLTASRLDPSFGEMGSGPGAGDRVGAGASVLHYAGSSAFHDWVEQEAGPAVFAVDASGHEVLDRRVAPELLAHARELLKVPRRPAPVREISDPDGNGYLVFAGGRAPGFTLPAALERAPGLRRGPRGMPPVGPTIATLLASVATALALAWYVAKPIRSLRTAFDAVAGGDLDMRVAPLIGTRKDELADLGRDFDRMADRLRASMIGQRMEEEIARIDRLVGDLLKLSRIEAGELGGPEEDFDLQELVHEVVRDANFEAQVTGRAVSWDEPTAAIVRGRPEMLQGAIENVVRNALNHAPGGSEVRIETGVDPKRTRFTLRVLDRGPGVPEQELARLFTPFFRAADLGGTEGYGLGLAIARRSIEAHGGAVSASNRPDGGLAVVVTLPVRESGRQAAEALPS